MKKNKYKVGDVVILCDHVTKARIILADPFTSVYPYRLSDKKLGTKYWVREAEIVGLHESFISRCLSRLRRALSCYMN